MNDKLNYAALNDIQGKPSNRAVIGITLAVFGVIGIIAGVNIFLPPEVVSLISNLMLVFFVLIGVPVLFLIVYRRRNLSLPIKELNEFAQDNGFVLKNGMRGLLGRHEAASTGSMLLTKRTLGAALRRGGGLDPSVNFSISGRYSGVEFEIATISQRYYPAAPYSINLVFYGLLKINDVQLNELPSFVVSPGAIEDYYLNDDGVRTSSWSQMTMPDSSCVYIKERADATELGTFLSGLGISAEDFVENTDGSLYVIIPNGLPLNEEGMRKVFDRISTISNSLKDLQKGYENPLTVVTS